MPMKYILHNKIIPHYPILYLDYKPRILRDLTSLNFYNSHVSIRIVTHEEKYRLSPLLYCTTLVCSRKHRIEK